MANCNKLFLDFDKELDLTKSKKENLKTSRENIRSAIEDYFKEHHPEYVPYFWIQGSYKMKTVIRYKDDTCDIDDGVYFFKEPDVSGKTLQTWVLNAVEDLTNTPSQHRSRCIRVIYKGDYHIDLPVYYKLDKDDDSEHPKLAVKDEEFEESDPKKFIKWFGEQRDEDDQLIRIIKYLKAWGDKIQNKMPSGLALTLLVCECIEYNNRDDVGLRNTLKAIKNRLNTSWVLKMPPPCPDDSNLFGSYDQDKKDHILDKLNKFIEDADEAIDNEANQLEASKLWKTHLGPYFPEGKDENVDKKENALRNKAASISAGAYTTSKGKITSKNEDNKQNRDHKFFGS
jgi:hypothetical protein